MDGAQFLERVREKYPDCVRILLTGYSEVQSIVAAINRGEIHRYISKPWDENDIVLVVKQALERKYLVDEKRRLEDLSQKQNEELKNLNASLDEKVRIRTEELNTANEKLRGSFLTSIKVFSALIEMRGGKLAGHSRRVADVGRRLANKMKLEPAEASDIFVAGLLVDIGKIAFSDELLNLPLNSMNGEQLGLFHKHTVRAEQILMPLEDLHGAARLLRSQHERFDGRGFPDQLTGDKIPLGAQILAVASDYDSLQTGGFLPRKIAVEDAQAMISRGAGVRYREDVVAAFKEIMSNKVKEPDEFQEVPPGQLQVGMVLSHDLISKEGTLLLPNNFKLTEVIIEKIKSYNTSIGGELLLKIRNG